MSPDKNNTADIDTVRIGGPEPEEPHKHSYMVTCSDLVLARWCPVCGLTWRAKRAVRNFTDVIIWEEIKED